MQPTENSLLIILTFACLFMLGISAVVNWRVATMQAEQSKILQDIVTKLAVIDARQQVQSPND